MGQTETRGSKRISSSTMAKFNSELYAGRWYDIAHLPNGYQNKCTSSVAFYIPEISGIYIANYCISDSMVVNMIEGRATQYDSEDSGKFKVKFKGLVTDRQANYWIYDTDYIRYSCVGDGTGNGFWILSRNHTISSELYTTLIAKMRNWGYNPERLVVNPIALTI